MDAKQSEVVQSNATEGRFGGWGTRKRISNTHVHTDRSKQTSKKGLAHRGGLICTLVVDEIDTWLAGQMRAPSHSRHMRQTSKQVYTNKTKQQASTSSVLSAVAGTASMHTHTQWPCKPHLQTLTGCLRRPVDQARIKIKAYRSAQHAWRNLRGKSPSALPRASAS